MLHTNAGSSSTTQKGYLGSQLFWLDRFGIANVVKLKSLEDRFHVKYDSKMRGGAFICKTSDGEVIFKRCPVTNFPYVDLDEEGENAAILMIQTVRDKFAGYTRQEVEGAIRARKLQARAGHPSEAVFRNEVSRKSESSLFRDSPVKLTDISNAHAIFGPSMPCRQGKWVRGKPERVEPAYVSIPAQIVELNKHITLVADVMFVNGLPFFITLSRKIRFLTVQYVPRRTAGELANALKTTLKLYHRAGFRPSTALMDGEFDKIKEKVMDWIVINTTAKNEHVGEIERKIRHVKERCRCTTADLPYIVLPNKVIKALVINGVMMLNCYRDKQGVSNEYSPRELVLRWQLGEKHLKHHFGSYGLAYEDPTRTNTQEPRAVEAICLGPTGNMQRGHTNS